MLGAVWMPSGAVAIAALACPLFSMLAEIPKHIDICAITNKRLIAEVICLIFKRQNVR